MIRKQTVPLSWSEILFAFGFKVLMGCLYGYIFLQYYQGSDTWTLHADSIKETQLLMDDPHRFFWEFTIIGNGLLNNTGHSLDKLEYYLQTKTIGIINLISQGNYYINVVFWNFLVFWGHYWLFMLLAKEFPSKRKIHFILVFLFPPAVFWLSGIRSDGLLFLSITLLLFHFHRWLSSHRFSSFLLTVVGLTGTLVVRPSIAALLIPACLSWWISIRFSIRPVLAFLTTYVLAALVFFGSTLLPSYNIPAVVVQKQHEFMKLKGSTLPLDTLEPGFKSFVTIFPQAAANTLLRPYPWEAKGVLQAMTVLEILIFWIAVVHLLFNHHPDWKKILLKPMLLAFVFFSLSLYFFIGYTVPFPGAIVRYKIIPELLLLCTLLACSKKWTAFN